MAGWESACGAQCGARPLTPHEKMRPFFPPTLLPQPALLARARALTAAADALLATPDARIAAERGAPLGLDAADSVGALMLLRETGAASAAAAWGEALLAAGRAGPTLTKDVAAATALAHCDLAAAAVEAGGEGATAAAASLGRAVAILDAARAAPALRAGAAGALAELAPAAAAVGLPGAASPAERAVAFDTLVRAAARPAGSAQTDPQNTTPTPPPPQIRAAWPHLDADEQAALVTGALDAGAAPPVPAGVAAAALVAAAVRRGDPSLVATAADLLASTATAGDRAPGAAAAAAAVALLLGDATAAADAAGVGRRRAGDGPAPDPRVAAFVGGVDGDDPLPGLCALTEAFVKEALSASRGGDALAASFTLDSWYASPGVALRLRARAGRDKAGAVVGAAVRAVKAGAGRVAARAVGLATAVKTAVARRRASIGDDGSDEETTIGSSATSAAARALAAPPALTEIGIDAARALTVGELQAAAAAADAAGWRDAPLPPSAVVPLADEADLWGRGGAPSTGRRAADAARVAGASILLLAAAAAGSLAAPGVRARALPAAARVAASVGLLAGRSALAAPPRPLTPAAATRLVQAFSSAKRAACGPSHDASALDAVATGRLASEWRGRAADLAADGWSLAYATKKVVVSSAPSLHTRTGKAVFRASVTERAVLRDGTGGAVDDGVATYTAEFVARPAGGGWLLESARVVG